MISIKKTPEFSEWLENLTWKEQGQINARLERIQNSSHFGDATPLETVVEKIFVDFGDYFTLLFDSFSGGLYQLRILPPPENESKIGVKEPQNRLKLFSTTVS